MSGLTSLVQAGGVLEKKIETVANNLANASTVGFKEDQPSFREVPVSYTHLTLPTIYSV